MSFCKSSGENGLIVGSSCHCIPLRGLKRDFYNGQNRCGKGQNKVLQHFGKSLNLAGMAVRSKFSSGLGLVLVQDFGLIARSRASGDEGVDRD